MVRLIRQAGRKTRAIPKDLRSLSACEEIDATARRQLGGLDLLVNNAAYQQSKPDIFAIIDEQMIPIFETNIYAPFRMSRVAAVQMQPGSVIINTGSVNNYDPAEELLDYPTTKGAILLFTKGLAKQLAKRGIRVNMVAPGPIWTLLQVSGGQLSGKLGEFGQDTPLFVLLALEKRASRPAPWVGAHGGKSSP